MQAASSVMMIMMGDYRHAVSQVLPELKAGKILTFSFFSNSIVGTNSTRAFQVKGLR